jgi:Zn-dependent membrane protease YugP
VQHAKAYPYLKFRSAMVPVQNASARVMNIIIMVMMFGGFFLAKSFPMDIVIYTLIACQSVITVFALVTLPVEFDASNRALAWLTNKGIVLQSEHSMAKDALKWAAMTYVIAALSAVATLLYYVMMLLGRRD